MLSTECQENKHTSDVCYTNWVMSVNLSLERGIAHRRKALLTLYL